MPSCWCRAMRDRGRRIAALEALAKPKRAVRRLCWRALATGEAMVVAHYLGDPGLSGFDRLYSGIERAGPFGHYTGNLPACFSKAISAASNVHATGKIGGWEIVDSRALAAFNAIPFADKCALFAALRSLPRVHPELVQPLRQDFARQRGPAPHGGN